MNKQFEEWLYGKKVSKLGNYDRISKMVYASPHFNNLPFSMQWGVYLEFFDSVGVIIQMNAGVAKKFYYTIHNRKWAHGTDIESRLYKDRPEAQQEAIKTAFEILDNQK